MLRNLGTRMALQITLVIFLVVSVSGVLTFVRVSRTVQENTQIRFSETVTRGSKQAIAQIEDTQRILLAGASILATSPIFVEHFANNDLAGVQGLADNLRKSVARAVPQETILVVYDASGRALGNSRGAPNPGTAIPADVKDALAGMSSQGMRRAANIGLTFAGAAPVHAPDGRILGVVEVVARIDENFVKRLDELTGAEVALIANDGSNVSGSDDLNPTIREVTQPALNTDQPVEVTIGNEQYLSLVTPLNASSGERVALMYVGVGHDKIVTEEREAQREVLTATAIAMTIGTLIAAGLGVLFTRPVTQLVRSARRIQENDLHSAVPRVGPRELRELGEAMDEMRLAILEAQENLVGANEQLVARVTASDAGLAAVTQELSVVHGVTTGIVQTPAEASRVVAEQLTRLDWINGVCLLLRADGQLRVVAEHGLRAGASRSLEGIVRTEFAGDVPLEGLYFENADSRGPMQVIVPLGIRSLALLPLVGARGNVGILAVAAERTTEFSESRRSLLQAVRAELTTSLERYELANAVEESRRLAESVIREMQDGAIVLDPEGRCVVCNPAAARLLNIDPELCRGCLVDEWMPLPPASIERLRRSAENTSEDTGDTLFEVEGRLLAFTAGPLVEADGARRGIIVLVRDVTETVAAERLKQDFVSMVGHELRTPLTLIRTSIDLLTEEAAGDLTPTQHRITDVLHNNSDRLLRLINDLLDMSALDSGRMRVHELPVRLTSVIDEVLPNYAHEAGEREVSITVEPGESFVVWADRARIEQVLSNLLDNAMKCTPTGGHITIRVLPGETFVLVQVQDNGIGILPSEQPLLFQKFQRTTAGERQSGGTGLGLAIARSIVELHGGKIWCESDGRSGSTFSFTLPIYTDQQIAAEDAPVSA